MDRGRGAGCMGGGSGPRGHAAAQGPAGAVFTPPTRPWPGQHGEWGWGGGCRRKLQRLARRTRAGAWPGKSVFGGRRSQAGGKENGDAPPSTYSCASAGPEARRVPRACPETDVVVAMKPTRRVRRAAAGDLGGGGAAGLKAEGLVCGGPGHGGRLWPVPGAARRPSTGGLCGSY